MSNLVNVVSKYLSGKEYIPVGILGPYDSSALDAIMKAKEAGWMRPVIIGNWPIEPDRGIKQLAVEGDLRAIRDKALSMLEAGTLAALLHTGPVDEGVLSFIDTLQGGNNTAASYVTLFLSLKENRLTLFTDTLVNRTPGLKEKHCIVLNASRLAQKLGIQRPTVAALAPIEIVNPAIPSTIKAAALAKMCERGQLGDVILEGPLAMDNAESSDAAMHKGISSPVPGNVDIYLFSDLESAMLTTQFVSIAGGIMTAGCLLGTRWPLIIRAPFEPDGAWLPNIALGLLMAVEAT